MKESFPSTPTEYDAYVEKHRHTPTQDPIYNHNAGSPDWRPSMDHENAVLGTASNPMADIIEKGSLTQAEIDALTQF